jgi:hypothetical protein
VVVVVRREAGDHRSEHRQWKRRDFPTKTNSTLRAEW